MFRCNVCKKLSKPNEPAIRVVVETRKKIYPAREKAMQIGAGLTKRWVADPGGIGTETVREELFCELCSQTGSIASSGTSRVKL